ncbi:MAG: glycosyltransferase family 2 protein [Candidatus Aenigmatarchaeota archaeon]
MPAFNEEQTIGVVLKRCLSLNIEKEIIAVDNGSTDATSDIVLNFADRHKEIIYLFESFKGKGNAIRRGLKYARGNYIVFQDADAEYSPEVIPSIVELLKDYDIVYGVRVGRLYCVGIFPYIANRIILRLINARFGSSLPDIFTGQRGYRRSVLDNMKWSSGGFNIETELTMLALKEGYSFYNLDVPYNPRTKEDGKKIGFVDFLSILSTFTKISWSLR